MEIRQKPTEIIVKQGKAKFSRKTTAKNMRGWITGYISKYSKENNSEMVFVFNEVLNAYNYFEPETTLGVGLKSWKGKSSMQIMRTITGIRVTKYQKPNKESEPIEIETDISNLEIQTMLDSIIELSRYSNTIKTEFLSMEYSKRLGNNHSGWNTGSNPIFCDRTWHNRYTILLSVLDEIGMISYSNGITTLLNNKLSFQESLDNYIKKLSFNNENKSI